MRNRPLTQGQVLRITLVWTAGLPSSTTAVSTRSPPRAHRHRPPSKASPCDQNGRRSTCGRHGLHDVDPRRSVRRMASPSSDGAATSGRPSSSTATTCLSATISSTSRRDAFDDLAALVHRLRVRRPKARLRKSHPRYTRPSSGTASYDDTWSAPSVVRPAGLARPYPFGGRDRPDSAPTCGRSASGEAPRRSLCSSSSMPPIFYRDPTEAELAWHLPRPRFGARASLTHLMTPPRTAPERSEVPLGYRRR